MVPDPLFIVELPVHPVSASVERHVAVAVEAPHPPRIAVLLTVRVVDKEGVQLF